MVREVAKFGGDVSGLVHPVVGAALMARYREQGFGQPASYPTESSRQGAS
jgi:hypothetical protein